MSFPGYGINVATTDLPTTTASVDQQPTAHSDLSVGPTPTSTGDPITCTRAHTYLHVRSGAHEQHTRAGRGKGTRAGEGT